MRHTVGIPVLVIALVVMATGTATQAQLLGLERARQMVLEHNPDLKSLAAEWAAAREAVRQASAYANPELEVEAEDFGQAEVGVMVTQPILIGGRRRAAIAVARRQAELAAHRLESGRLALEAELIRRFVPVLAARERLALVDSLLEISNHGIEAVQRRVDAGATAEIDVVRAELERDELVLERADLERSLAQAGVRLGGLWGESILGFDGVEGTLPAWLDVPPVEVLTVEMERHPETEILEVGRSIIEAEMAEERAEGAPELAVSAGYLRNTEAEESSVVAGLALSLPIFNRNKAAVAEKHHQIAAAGHESRRLHLERSADLAALCSEIDGLRKELAAISNGVLPKATRIHSALEAFYAEGRTGILDVLEARKHLLEVQMRTVDLLEQQALSGADLIELTGYRVEIVK
jgi:cobalt-zinc-cadmium efflux system outer membrane protein